MQLCSSFNICEWAIILFTLCITNTHDLLKLPAVIQCCLLVCVTHRKTEIKCTVTFCACIPPIWSTHPRGPRQSCCVPQTSQRYHFSQLTRSFISRQHTWLLKTASNWKQSLQLIGVVSHFSQSLQPFTDVVSCCSKSLLSSREVVSNRTSRWSQLQGYWSTVVIHCT